jgi:hypothetical protein
VEDYGRITINDYEAGNLRGFPYYKKLANTCPYNYVLLNRNHGWKYDSAGEKLQA